MLLRLLAAVSVAASVAIPANAVAAACPHLPDRPSERLDPSLDLLSVSLAEHAGATVVTTVLDAPPTASPSPPHVGRDYVVELALEGGLLVVVTSRSDAADRSRVYWYGDDPAGVSPQELPAWLVGADVEGEAQEGSRLVLRVRLPRGAVPALRKGARVTRIAARTSHATGSGSAGINEPADAAGPRTISYLIGTRGCP